MLYGTKGSDRVGEVSILSSIIAVMTLLLPWRPDLSPGETWNFLYVYDATVRQPIASTRVGRSEYPGGQTVSCRRGRCNEILESPSPYRATGPYLATRPCARPSSSASSSSARTKRATLRHLSRTQDVRRSHSVLVAH